MKQRRGSRLSRTVLLWCTASLACAPTSSYRQITEKPTLRDVEFWPPDAEVTAIVAVVFASWCEPCRRELKHLEQRVADDCRLRVIGLNAFESWSQKSNRQQLRAFLDEHAPWLPVVEADEVLLESLGGVDKIPSVFVFDQRGNFVRALRPNEGAPSLAEVDAAIDAVLGT